MILLAAINWHTFFFMLFAILACVFSLGVLFSSNVVRMAFYLILALAATAGLFFLAGAHFVGAMQIMIYVGGTLVLLIFGVMLTAQATFVSMKTHGGEWVLAAIVGGALLFLLAHSAISVQAWTRSSGSLAEQTDVAPTAPPETPLGAGLIGLRLDQTGKTSSDEVAGMSGYLLPFEVISVHLLVVLIGAAYLARPKRRVATADSQDS